MHGSCLFMKRYKHNTQGVSDSIALQAAVRGAPGEASELIVKLCKRKPGQEKRTWREVVGG